MTIHLPAGSDRIDLMLSFQRMVEAGSLSAAAQQLGTSQPTMSRRLQTLERLLGVKLLQRSTHGMQLTEEGQRCFAHAQELVARWQTMEADLRGPADQPRGTLRVAVPHAYGQEQLVHPLARYLQLYPLVNVEWTLHDRQPNFVADGIDCAIRVGMVEDLSAVAIRAAQVRRIVVAAPSVLQGRTLQSPADLASLPWLAASIFYRNELLLQRVDAPATQQLLEIAPRLTTDNLYALLTAARQGLGLGVVSAWLVDEDLRQGRLQHVLPQWEAAPQPVSIVYPHARFYPAKLRHFVEIMREAIPHMPGMRRS